MADITTKQFVAAEVKALDGPEYPHGGFESTISAAFEDRDGEVIDSGAFNPLPQSIPIFGDHVATIATTVARATPYYDTDGTLRARGKFAADAYSQMVRDKVKGGFVDSMSVGFMSPERYSDDKGVPHIKRGELLEASFVPIPSLRQATVAMAKSLTTDLLDAANLKVGARNSSKDQQTIQAVHDAACSLGADCGDGKAAPEAETKAPEPDAHVEEVADLALGALDTGDEDVAAAALGLLATTIPA